jgi:8-oxo-dGTP pyrophosphatase MutT (NUDIX family)
MAPDMNIETARENAHYIAVTGIVRKRGDDGTWRYLLCKRSEQERLFPGKWCVPGGRLQQSDFVGTPKDTNDHWFDVLERTLAREIKEETNLEIANITYVSNLALVRPNGFSTVIISLAADWAGNDVILHQADELVDYLWATLEEAKEVDLIENIWEQLAKVEQFSRDRSL